MSDVQQRRIGTAQAKTRTKIHSFGKNIDSTHDFNEGKKTITEKWHEIDKKRVQHSNDLKHILNFNEYPSQGFMYKRGLSNKNISTANKVKRISTKYLREKKPVQSSQAVSKPTMFYGAKMKYTNNMFNHQVTY